MNASGESEIKLQSVPSRISLPKLLFYQSCDAISEVVIFFMVLFSPWALGTTDPWAIWIMNGMGYLLGGLFLSKVVIRWSTGYKFPRWIYASTETLGGQRVRLLTRCLAGLTSLILGYCLLSAVNAAATYDPEEARLHFHSCWSWLPHSYDASRSWQAFFRYLAIGLAFWALVDWLSGKTAEEERKERNEGIRPGLLPERMRRLLWVLTINGALLGLEGILQRLKGTGLLLFSIVPKVPGPAMDHFGPFNFRANACQYLNLIWPASLALWWTIQRSKRRHSRRHIRIGSHHVILLAVIVMAMCPLISADPWGAGIAVFNVILAAVVLCMAQREDDLNAKVLVVLGAVATLGIGAWIGWGVTPNSRLHHRNQLDLTSRDTIYQQARPLANEHPVWGTGPGTFRSLFSMYKTGAEDTWPEQLNNDWRETLLTFGAAGTLLILAALAGVLLRWGLPGGVSGGRRVPALIWGALAGCLLHAWFSCPFQIYSVLFAFVVVCSVMFCLSRPE